MRAFQVYVNGDLLFTAGIGDDGVLTTIVSWVVGKPPRTTKGQLKLSVGGLCSPTGERLEWPSPEIAIGDEIMVRVIETNEPLGANASASATPGRRTDVIAEFEHYAEQLKKGKSVPELGES